MKYSHVWRIDMKLSRAVALAAIFLSIFAASSAQARNLTLFVDYQIGEGGGVMHQVNDDGRGSYLGQACGYTLYATQGNTDNILSAGVKSGKYALYLEEFNGGALGTPHGETICRIYWY